MMMLFSLLLLLLYNEILLMFVKCFQGDAGYESSKDGNGSCRPCQEGKVKIKASAEGCEDCPNNKTTLMDGAKDKITECVSE